MDTTVQPRAPYIILCKGTTPICPASNIVIARYPEQSNGSQPHGLTSWFHGDYRQIEHLSVDVHTGEAWYIAKFEGSPVGHVCVAKDLLYFSGDWVQVKFVSQNLYVSLKEYRQFMIGEKTWSAPVQFVLDHVRYSPGFCELVSDVYAKFPGDKREMEKLNHMLDGMGMDKNEMICDDGVTRKIRMYLMLV